jgi:FAD/FMN-containing dehydrogenase
VGENFLGFAFRLPSKSNFCWSLQGGSDYMRRMSASTLAPESLLARFAAAVGARNVLTERSDTSAFLTEPRDLFIGRALCVLRPGTTQEVAAIMQICDETGTAVVPQGGNTGLVGGQIPDQTGDEVVISMRRLDRLRELDPASNTMTVEAGMTLARVQEEAVAADRLFPLSLASEGSCTIGGNLATNAGGTAALAYGLARDLVVGLEVVLADGRVLPLLSKLKKDNTGYDLVRLFLGSEGTLGLITAAVLKLFPKPRAVETAFIGLADPGKALALLELVQGRAGQEVKTFEIIARIGLDIVIRHAVGARDPLVSRHPWYVLVELTSQRADGLSDLLETVLSEAFERGLIEDAAVAASLDQRRAFWKLREELSDMQKHEGGSIKHDVSVPVAQVPTFLEEMEAAVEAAIPGARPVPFGHLGDGNIHANVSQPVGADKQAFLARWGELNEIVHDLVIKHGGSISAEHGIGALKRDLLPGVKDPAALDLMRRLKVAFDPKGLLNPGKVIAL